MDGGGLLLILKKSHNLQNEVIRLFEQGMIMTIFYESKGQKQNGNDL